MDKNDLIEKFWTDQGGKNHMKEDLWFYESDWSMLMPVLEKVAELDHVYKIELYPGVGCSIYSDETFESFEAGIKATYTALTDFLQYHYNR